MRITSAFDYRNNGAVFESFYSAQRTLTAAIGRRPALVLLWLQRHPPPHRSQLGPSAHTSAWRTSRLSGYRHRGLTAAAQSAAARAGGPAQADTDSNAGSTIGEGPAGAPSLDAVGELARMLLAWLPVAALAEIAEGEGGADALPERIPVVSLREALFRANVGLARSAAAPGRPDDFGDRLSAASCGLLDAIDRYVPGEQSARFSYFAAYWIRYHVSRQAQKFGSLVAFPIHQHRLQSADRAAGAAFERPRVFSLQAPADADNEEADNWDLMLCNEDPAPCSVADGDEVVDRIRRWLHTSLPPATRVMLAFGHSIGSLPEAAEDYLRHLREIASERLRHLPT